jgi:hypothetical protein
VNCSNSRASAISNTFIKARLVTSFKFEGTVPKSHCTENNQAIAGLSSHTCLGCDIQGFTIAPRAYVNRVHAALNQIVQHAACHEAGVHRTTLRYWGIPWPESTA